MEKMMEIKNDAERKLIMALLEEKNFDSYRSVAKKSGISRQWVKKLLPKFRDEYKIIDYDEKNVRFSIKKKNIQIKEFSLIKTIVEKEKMELNLLKDLVFPVTIGMLGTFLISIFFNINMIFVIIGGIIPFTFQFTYGCYKILTSKETMTKIFIPEPEKEIPHIK